MNPIEITTHAEFSAAVLATVDAAIERRARSLLWPDPHFTRWPLDDPALIEANRRDWMERWNAAMLR